MCKEYNGYTNYPTWAIGLWYDNDHGAYDYWQERGQELTEEHGKEEAILLLAQEMEEDTEAGIDGLKEAFNGTELANGMASDLLMFALAQVNWLELAETTLSD